MLTFKMAEKETRIMLRHDNRDLFETTLDSLLLTIGVPKQNKSVSKIEEAVYKYIKMIVDEVEKKEPHFRVSEILKVGSFNEGTKIIGPNEFDFLVVIDELSRPGAVVVERDSVQGNVLLTLNDDRMKERWGKYCVNGYLSCFQHNTDTRRIQDSFGTVVVDVIRKIEGKRGFKDKLSIVFVDPDNPNYRCKLSELNHIHVFRVDAKNPNVLLEFIVEKCVINVDLSPAIRYQPVKDCFNTEDCASAKLAEAVVDRGSILLVGKLDKRFRVTFTETEVDYMQNKIVKKHKLLYMYLKYIMHLFSMTPMTSYMLKMICIRHDLECTDIDQKLSVCFDEVISVIARCFEERKVPSVFNMQLSIELDTPVPIIIYRQHVLEAIRKISQLDPHSLTLEKVVAITVDERRAYCGTGILT